MKYVVVNHRETLIITFLVIQILSAFCTKEKGQICESCPKEKRYKLNLYKWVL